MGLLSWSLGAYGQKLVVKTSPPQHEKVSQELIYYYEVSQYVPQPLVGYSKQYTNASPEEATMSILSAMSRGEYDKWRASWDEDARKTMEAADVAAKRTPEFWKQAWAKAFPGTAVKFTDRVESGDYVIINCRLLHPGQENVKDAGIEMIFTFKKQKDGNWLATQDFESDPVLLYWKKPGYVMQRVVRDK